MLSSSLIFKLLIVLKVYRSLYLISMLIVVNMDNSGNFLDLLDCKFFLIETWNIEEFIKFQSNIYLQQ